MFDAQKGRLSAPGRSEAPAQCPTPNAQPGSADFPHSGRLKKTCTFGSGLAKSTKAWSDLLRSLGIEPRLEILTPLLKTNTDATDPHEEKLEDVIANKDEVAALLNEAGAPFNDMHD